MDNRFIVDYNTKMLIVLFDKEAFTFDLSDGDTGDFWNSFTQSNGTIKDINFYQDNENEVPSVSIYGVKSNGLGELFIDTNDEILLTEHIILGDILNYFS